MTIQQLQYIVALDNHRHFVKAAESCHVAQPTLTLQVKKLEEQINMVLFDRSSQPIKPTPMGEIFIKKARLILREINELKGFVAEEKSQMEGTFKIGIIPTLSPYLLPLFLGQFLQDYPNTRLIIHEMQTDEIIEKILHDQLDIGLLATPLQEPKIREIPVFHEPFLVYASERHQILEHKTIDIKDLKNDDLWLIGKGHCFRNQAMNVCDFEDHAEKGNLRLEGGSLETLKQMLHHLPGFTLIPELAYKAEQDQSNTRRFKQPEPSREISLVTHKNFTKELILDELRKSILAHIPSHFKKNERFFRVQWR